jgi:DNA-binding CsgD family transcriptional regulator
MVREWKPILLYGALLAIGTTALAWLDSRRFLWRHGDEIATFAVAAGFLIAGLWIGMRVLGAPRPLPFDGNPAARAALGISPRELAVLEQLASGRSNREIADALHVSPNTVKTHIARLFEKLEAKRRTDAIARARELGLIR